MVAILEKEEEMERIGDWMQTYTGKRFWPLDPSIEDICIEDIAASLSKLCRYGGHTRFFYSVAEHSVLVSQFVPDELALWGLLHDASEAYLSDMVKPLKNGLPSYRNLEFQIMRLIAEKFNLIPFPQPEAISKIDKAILRDEQLKVMRPCKFDWWCTGDKPIGAEISGWKPERAECEFLRRFNNLKGA
jgi:hypothetical protein